MNEPTPNQVFICYAREDMATAKRLYQDLQRAGITPWMDTEVSTTCVGFVLDNEPGYLMIWVIW
jgi:hypothetical protein